MDRYEYKVRIAQIKSLIENGEFFEALQIVDTIDWRRVRSIQTLCMVSEIYKVNRKYDEARDVLLLAYNRYPGARSVVYALCELAIKMDRITEAVHYLKEYMQIANGDSGMYVLQYKLYQSQGVGIEERIEVLKKLKSLDYQEKWAYELAKLYHEDGQESQCIAECDEMIVWFGHGSFVTKAMELKMLHAPLTPEQQKKYDHRNDWKRSSVELTEEEERDERDERDDYPEEVPEEKEAAPEEPKEKEPIPIGIKHVEASNQPTKKIPQKEIEAQLRAEDIKIRPINLDKFSTMNLQDELRKNMAEFSAKTGVQLREVEEPIESRIPIMAAPVPVMETAPEEPSEIEEESEVKEAPEEEVGETHDEETGNGLGADADYVSDETGRIDIDGIIADWDRRAEEHGRNRIARAKIKSLEQTNDIVNELVGKIPGVHTAPIPEIPEDEFESTDASVRDDEEAAAPDVSEESLETAETESTDRDADQETAAENADMSEITDADSVSEDIEETEETEETDSVETEPEEEEAEEAGMKRETLEETTDLTGILTGKIPVTTGGAFAGRRIEVVENAEESEDEEESESTSKTPVVPFRRFTDTGDDVEVEAEEEDEEEDYAPVRPVITPEIRIGSSRKYIAPSNREAEGFDEEERKIFSEFLSTHDLPEEIRAAIDGMDMQGSTGNIVITGNEQSVRMKLAQALAKCWEEKSASFEGKIACIDANKFNTKDVRKSLGALNGGILVIAHSGDLEDSTLQDMRKCLEDPDSRAIIILEENNMAARRMEKTFGWFNSIFSQKIDIPEYTNDDLVFHGREYARGKEYTIDDMGVLALYTRIDEMQTADHFVTVDEVEDIVDQAIRHADRRTPQHFIDLIVGKRYDDNDLIVLREKDFVR